MGYQPEQWHDLFVAIAGASAALAGLIFVAVSLNLKRIMEGRALPSVAARSLAVLVALMLMCTFGLTPGQNHGRDPQAGAESEGEDEVLLQWKIGHIATAALATTPMVVAGLSTWLGSGGGLYWALAETVAGLVASVLYAWVLLIEILR